MRSSEFIVKGPYLEDRKNADFVYKFVKFAGAKIGLQEPLPEIQLSYDHQDASDNHHTGKFTPSDNKIWVYAQNRNLVDILRSIAHELQHAKQHQDGRIEQTYPGHPLEQESDVIAGYLIKLFGKKYHDIFQ